MKRKNDNMKELLSFLKRSITPFAKENKTMKMVSLGIMPILIWMILPDSKFPPVSEIIEAFPKLISKNDLINNFIISISFCFKCVFYSTVIAFIFFAISQIPILKPFVVFCRKFRFLPSVGLSFLFMRLTGDVDSQMTWIMVFGVSTYLIDSAVGLALSVTNDQVDYTKSLRLSPFESLRELIIYGKLSDFLGIVIQNFAIAWMLLASVENICKSSGGIGVVIAESAKYTRLHEVYAIQILILFTGVSLDFLLNKLKGFLFPYTILKQNK